VDIIAVLGIGFDSIRGLLAFLPFEIDTPGRFCTDYVLSFLVRKSAEINLDLLDTRFLNRFVSSIGYVYSIPAYCHAV
jgi:hypothetical protein